MSAQPSSITDFLQSGNFHFRVFDLGRRVTRLSNQLFTKIETQQAMYPYPFQQSAWIAVLFWDKYPSEAKRSEPIIWFLKFPIDELGYLQLSSRDAFLQQLFDQLGTNFKAQQQGKALSDNLKESPFAFKPKADRLAIFHSKAAKILSHDPSHYYAPTRDYLRGDLGYEQWQSLGLQGITDVLARLDKDNNSAILTAAIAHIPNQPLEVIANLMEHIEPNKALSDALLTKLKTQIKQTDSLPLLAALLRSLSNSQIKTLRYQAWELLLQSKQRNEIELLAVLSGRAWNDLRDEKRFKAFLEALAECDQQQFFIILVDLMAIPTMRDALLKVMRLPDRSEQLAQRIGLFFQQSRAAIA
jgi:hypothetical protein